MAVENAIVFSDTFPSFETFTGLSTARQGSKPGNETLIP
jgi:hypothetical protein